MVNFNTQVTSVPSSVFMTFKEIRDKPGLWMPMRHSGFILLVPHCPSKPIVFYIGESSQAGKVYITENDWDGYKYVPYEGTLTIGPVTH